MPPSPAQQLVQLISQAVNDIEADTAAQLGGALTTDINASVVAPEDDVEVSPKRREAIRTLKAASHQLLATLLPAGYQVVELSHSHFQSMALDIVCRAKVADLIHALEPQSVHGGIHVELLAKRARMHPRKLTHILRFLAIRNVFCEVTRDHWANTRCSVALRTNSSNTVWNFVSHNIEDIGKPAMVEFAKLVLDHENGGAQSWDPHKSATLKYNKAEGQDVFHFMATSEGGYRAERLGKAMIEVTRTTHGSESHFKGFDWAQLGKEGDLVDVGGGIGAAAYYLTQFLPGWNVIIQDRPEVIKAAKEHYKDVGSKAKLVFEESNFLQPQPNHRVGKADAYFLRHILHDWPDEECVQILKQLRKAAKPSTVLLICETCLEAPLPTTDSPLLSNGGMAASLDHCADLSMLTVFNSNERGKDEFKYLFERGGWKLRAVSVLASYIGKCIFEGVIDPAWVE